MFWQKDTHRELRKQLGKEKVSDAPEILTLYGLDATPLRSEPALVAFPETTDEVQLLIQYALERDMAVTARGAGSGLSGGSVPVHGGMVISTERMKRIARIDSEKMACLVQPGVVTSMLQQKVGEHGLFYPPDPSSHTVSTIGGNIAENAGGLRCFKYGVTSHYVLGLEFINAKGEICRTGALDASKAEPDLTSLLIGSEGTLGFITHAALRLIDKPETTYTISAYFDNSETAFSIAEHIVAQGWQPSVMEYISDLAMSASADHARLHLPKEAKAMLLLELDGSKAEVEELKPLIAEFLQMNALEVHSADMPKDQEALWQLRRNISPSLIRLATGKIHEDIAVPRSRLRSLSNAIDAIADEFSVRIPVYGHAGDGNLHVVILYEENEDRSKQNAQKACDKVFRTAIDMGGTITGEHGIGALKKMYMPWQFTESELNLFRETKKVMDLDGLFNPGKILD
ncbi:FAD-binding oxidoreductase [Calditrichota bacterium]